MRIAYFPKQTALQSEPVWQGFLDGCKKCGMTPVLEDYNADAAVIWSALWHGRMRLNKGVYDHFKNQGKPVFIIEVGALKRGETWKISVNNITSQGIYANGDNLNVNRPKILGIDLQPIKNSRKKSILLVGQHESSIQWEGMPSTLTWMQNKIQEIRQHTDLPIVVRPHPRSMSATRIPGATVEIPKKLENTYDLYNIDFDHHCVVAHNSGPSLQSIISGTPVICHSSSLAFPMSVKMENIGNPTLSDRKNWFIDLCHTEWTLEEIQAGIPQKRLLEKIKG